MGLISPTDVSNRALQKCGVTNLIASGALLTEASNSARQVRACYDTLRRAELRRNVWTFACRRTVLRAYQTPSNIVGVSSSNPALSGGVTRLITFGTFNIATTYAQSDIVTGSDGHVYISRKGANMGNDPTLPTSFVQWELYFGPDAASEFVTTWVNTITYDIGNNVIGSDGNPYMAKTAANTNHNPVGDGGVHWVTGTSQSSTSLNASFYSGELAYVGENLYLSLVNSNTVDPTTNVDSVTGNTFTNAWMQMTTAPTIAELDFIFPIGAGPLADNSTRNVFRLPVGFLRDAPQAPKQGSSLFLGSPGALPYTDWEFDGDYILSVNPGPLIYRFVADFQDTTRMDPMFIEGFSCRIGLEVCEPLTQATDKLSAVANEYSKIMGEARTVNGIEQGATEPPEDDYITTRR